MLLVDPADELNAAGANALLKLLEEPPAGVVICSSSASGPACCRAPSSRAAPSSAWRRCRRPRCVAGPARGWRPSSPPSARRRWPSCAGARIGRALELEADGWLERYAELLPELVAARDSAAARLALADQAGASAADGRGFRAPADLLGRRPAPRSPACEAGRPPGPELVPGEPRAAGGAAAGRGLDHWVALWDKLAALAGRVEAFNLDPLQTLLQIVQGVCGAEPEAGSRIG